MHPPQPPTPPPTRVGAAGGFNGNGFDDNDSGTSNPGDRMYFIGYHRGGGLLLPHPYPVSFLQYALDTLFGGVASPVRGQTIGYHSQPVAYALRDKDRIVGICGQAGEFVDYLSIQVNHFDQNDCTRRGFGGNPFYLPAPPGYAVRGFFGRSGSVVDAIGIIAEPDPNARDYLDEYPIGAAGGWGGDGFWDDPPPAGSRVAEIRVAESCYVGSIQLVYAPFGRTFIHGGSGSCPDNIGHIVGLYGWGG
jgi:hypothetical protein